MVSCATTSSGGGYSYGGAGGSAGNLGTQGCTKAPDCNQCQGNCATCTCVNGAAQCQSVCASSTGGSGQGGSSSGGTSGLPACCGSCTKCFDKCVCSGGDPTGCVTACNGSGGSGQGGSGQGGSGQGGSGQGGSAGSGFGGSGQGGSGFGGSGGSGFGGSGGSGFGGSGGSGGGGTCSGQTATCQQIDFDGTGSGGPCTTCMTNSCCSQVNGCFGDPGCAGLEQCVSQNCANASDVTACAQQSCGQCLTQTAVDEHNAVADCLKANCSTQCQ